MIYLVVTTTLQHIRWDFPTSVTYCFRRPRLLKGTAQQAPHPRIKLMENYVTKPIPGQKPPVQLVTRPWGDFKQFAHNEEVTVSLMVVQPGQRLSLQSHTARAELWIILDDGATVQVGDEIVHPRPGVEIAIPAPSKHQWSSHGKAVRVLEGAFGNWQQNDVTRYDDDYRRPEQEPSS